jgi:hypothetical protein
MIPKANIDLNLDRLEILYNAATNPLDALFYAKLAIIELGGWVEQSIDLIIKDLVNRFIEKPENLKLMEERIKRTYAFHYNENFRYLLTLVVGITNVERLEAIVDPSKFAILTATLSALKTVRDAEAHTHLCVTKTLNAPSVSKANLIYIYDGLVDIEVKFSTMAI